MDSPRVRQVLFILDSHHATYKFDVNQTITIRSLKKMIITAANLCKSGLRVFHKGTEFTKSEDLALQELFPNLQVVELNVNIDHEHQSANKREREAEIILRLGEYCPAHNYKYPYFYCYDCKFSFCSICMQTGSHTNHTFIEKYDYLQNSKNFVDPMFHDMKDFLEKAKLDEKSVEDIRMKILTNFHKITSMLKKIEINFLELIDNYSENEKVSYYNMQKNVDSVKMIYSKGLEEVKKMIEIEDMMIDQDIFLTYDRKIKEILQEKLALMNDVKDFENMKKNIPSISKIVDNFCNELSGVLTKYVDTGIYMDMKNKISESSIKTVNEKEIHDKFMSGVKESSSKSCLFRQTPSKNDMYPLRLEYEPQGFKTADVTPNVIPSTFPIFKGLQTNLIEPPVVPSQKNDYKGIFISLCKPNTKEVIVYDNDNNKMEYVKVDFPSFLGTSSFLENCASLNINGKLYISGGLKHGIPRNSFLVFDINTKAITMLPEMTTARHSHSMYHHNDFIYVVGGNPFNTTEKYDIINQKWIKLASLVSEERLHPMLFVNNNYLYAFFGFSNLGGYLDSVERLNIRNLKAKWEIVAYKNIKNLDLKMYGCGIIPNKEKENEIYFFGGKSKDRLRNTAVKFDFSNNNFEQTEVNLVEGIYFQESSLADLGGNSYGHFNMNQEENFFKIQLG